MTTFPKNIVEKLQVIPGGIVSLIKRGESNFRPDIPPPQPPENPSGAMFEFSTHNGNDSELPTMLAVMPSDNSWAVIDADTGELLANSSGAVADGITVNTLPPEQQDPNHTVFMILFARNGGGVRKYKVSGPHQMLGIALIDVFNPGVEIIDGLVNVECFSNHVNRYTFSIVAADLRVPMTLPSHITDLSDMFTESNQFNQDLSRWNTSKVTGMASMFSGCVSFNQDIGGWNVGNVVNMGFMFDKASSFNQDLSGWCVKNIPRLPPNFDRDAYRWAMSRPAWGTCPGEEEVDPPYVPPVEEDVDKDTIIKAFDYALIRYRWTPTGGEDLDTRTYLSKPNRSGRRVGWNRLKNDNSYLIWNEDNTGSGVESVLIDIDKIHDDYPGEQIIELKMDGFWYSQVKSGKLDIEFATFKGGKMVASGYDWINEGGLAIQILKLGVDTLVQQSSNIDGENLATLSYDTLLKKGTLVARDGPSVGDGGTVEPEEPEVPPTGDPDMPVEAEPMEFIVSSLDSYGGSLAFHIDLFAPQTGWSVYVNDVLAANDSLGNLEYLSKEIKSGYIRLSLKNMQGATKNIKIHGRADTIQLTHLGWGAIPTPSRTVDVTSFGTRIRNIKVNLGQCNITVPNALPAWMTDLTNMFSGARQFNQDISMWDTSHVTKMTSMFSTCDDFNQDISKWDVSKVTNMDYMFDGAESFNQDLSGWCVHSITSAPASFDNGTSNWAKPKPVWGTCPDAGGPVTDPNLIDVSGLGEPYIFSTNSLKDPSKEMAMSIRIYKYTAWQLVDLDSNLVISNSNRYFAPGVADNQSQSDEAYITLQRTKTGVSNYALYTMALSVTFEGGRTTVPTTEDSEFNLTQWGTETTRTMFHLKNTLTTIPNTLPPTVTSTSLMFYNNNLFNQDISVWDTSNVTEMEQMFNGASVFNQDLSGWCVSNIPVTPNYFSANANAWTLPKPVWGTCPSKEPAPSTGTLKFTTQNLVIPSQRMKGTITLTGLSGDWQLLGGDTVLHSNVSTANVANYTVYLTDWFAHEPTFEFIGTADKVIIDIHNGFAGINPIGIVTIESFSNTVANQTISAPACTLTVPDTLPAGITSTNKMFRNCSEFNQDISMWDTSNVKDMSFMFAGASNFNQDISSWDVGQVTNMNSMFDSAKNFNQDLSGWNVSLIPSEPDSFAYSVRGWTLPKPIWGGKVALPTTQPLHFNIVSEAAGNGANSFGLSAEGVSGEWYILVNDSIVAGTNVEKAEGFDSELYEDTLNATFNNLAGSTTDIKLYCTSNSVRLYNGAIPSNPVARHVNVLSFSETISNYLFEFKHCTATVPQTLPSHITSLSDLFSGSTKFNQDLSGWDTSNVTEMARTFLACESFNGDITTWNTSNVTTMDSMFNRATAFNRNISAWDVSKVERMLYMFAQAGTFNQDLSSWNVRLIPTKPFSFDDLASSWTKPKPVWGTDGEVVPVEPDNTLFIFNVDHTGYATGMPFQVHATRSGPWEIKQDGVVIFDAYTKGPGVTSSVSGDKETVYIEAPAGALSTYEVKGTMSIVKIITNENNSFKSIFNVTQFSSTIKLHNFNVYKSELTVPDTLPAYVTNTSRMFEGTYLFNHDISAWDTTNVTDMRGMFSNARAFNQPIGNWDTSNVKDMSNIFNSTESFDQDLSGWDTSKVTDMSYAFEYAAVFDGNITTWNTSSVMDMAGMFSNALMFNQDIGGWQTGLVEDMDSMFEYAESFNQDLSNWDTTNITSEPYGFSDDAISWTLPKPTWGYTPPKSTFVAVDISGASGVYLTLSKNDGPWTTFNLADPSFDVDAFQKFVIMGKDNSSFAFLDWPAPLNPEDELGEDKTPGIGGLVNPAGMVAPGHPNGYRFVDGVYVPPILLNTPISVRNEVNTLRIKQSAGAPAGYDIFFTIPGAVEGGILEVVSTVVFPFTAENIYTPPV